MKGDKRETERVGGAERDSTEARGATAEMCAHLEGLLFLLTALLLRERGALDPGPWVEAFPLPTLGQVTANQQALFLGQLAPPEARQWEGLPVGALSWTHPLTLPSELSLGLQAVRGLDGQDLNVLKDLNVPLGVFLSQWPQADPSFWAPRLRYLEEK